MERLELAENQSEGIALALSAAEAAALNQTGLVQAAPAPDGRWELFPCRNKVGAIRVGQRDIVVRSKAKFSSLLFMLAYAQDQRFSPGEFDGLADDELWPAVGETLVRLAERALERGVLRGYVTKDDRRPVVRGRVRISDQLTRHQGIPVPLEVRYSDFSIDTPENRLLRAALRRMASVDRLPGDIARNLRHLEGRLGAATRLTAGAPRPAWSPNRLNERYVPALHLAELILDSIGLATAQGEQPMASFVVNMAAVFEAFVGAASREALSTMSSGLTRQQFPTYLTYDRRFPIRPDVVHLVQGQAQAVYDAKYKLEEKLGDLYQMHACCAVLKLNTGHLVYAGFRFSGEDAAAVVRNARITIRVYPLDVTVAPAELLAQVHEIAEASLETASVAHG
ncbi:MAG: McrC family protein [Propionibacteriaceae bacterium]|jgi:5-methylcytosine-specific restriction enzyme subunit McrC|nr:McrC family protein [Propionibacteriaceae bacterium]